MRHLTKQILTLATCLTAAFGFSPLAAWAQTMPTTGLMMAGAAPSDDLQVPTGTVTPRVPPSSKDNYIYSQGDSGWVFLAGPEHSAHTMVRLTDATTAGQIGFFCSMDGTFDFVVFPTPDASQVLKPGAEVRAKLRVAGTTKYLPMTSVGGPEQGYVADGQAVPAILHAIAGIPQGIAQDMEITLPNGVDVTADLPSPRALVNVSSNLCSQWFETQQQARQ